MVIRIRSISYNTRTKKVNLDRRTLGRNAPDWKHAAYIVGGVIVTSVVALAVNAVTK